MTAEAAIALPLFIIAVMSAAMAIQLHFADSGVSDALVSAAFTANAADSAAEGIMAKAELDSGIGHENNTEPFFSRKTEGIITLISGFGGGRITLSADYRVKGGGIFLAGMTAHRSQRVTAALFTGYEPGSAGCGESGYEYIRVLMTDYGSVYHTHSDCTYLTRHPRQVSYDQLQEARNEDGGKYHRCRYCTHSELCEGECAWITGEGECYHTDPCCKAIKPVYREVLIKDDGSIRCCSRCEKRLSRC
ncbi:MAG: hypothetical protein IJM62_07510 [Lachnospiraceae bacterium]|nr:hypothetical protein [Lachnospiraceae bacterium]